MKLNIRKWRNLRGMTQLELARAIGKSRPMIPEYESGKTDVSTATLVAIATALNVSVNDLFEDETEEVPTHA